MMRFLWSTALKDLRRRRRDPLSLLGWIGGPLVFTLLLNVMFSGGSATPHGLLLVADEDDTIASRFLLGAFSQGRLAEMLTVEKVAREPGRARIAKGDGSALLVIPKGFGGAVLRNEPVQLNLLTNPAQSILPDIIEETLSIVADGAFYAQLLAGDELRAFAGGPPNGATLPDLVVSLFSVRINQLVRRLQTYLNPPLIQLAAKVVDEGPTLTFAETFFPATFFMALLFMAQGLSADIWKEHAQGALRRAATMPQRLETFLAGKVLGAAMVIALVALVGLAAGRWLAGVKMSHPLAALLWVTFSGTVFFLLLMLVQVHASTMRTANILGSLVLFPLAMLGGSFFPFEIMPAGLVAIGRWTPNGRAVLQFKAMLAGSIQPAQLAATFAALAALGALALLLEMRRLRKIL